MAHPVLVVVVVAAAFVEVDSRLFIPGQGCGITRSFNHLAKLGPEDNIEELECTTVEDEASFRKFYLDQKPGQFIDTFFVNKGLFLKKKKAYSPLLSKTISNTKHVPFRCRFIGGWGFNQSRDSCLLPNRSLWTKFT